MTYVIVYRALDQDPWIPFCCSGGRYMFDQYESCFRARQLVQMGFFDAEVHPIGEEGVFCRFFRSVTGDVVQDGGVEL